MAVNPGEISNSIPAKYTKEWVCRSVVVPSCGVTQKAFVTRNPVVVSMVVPLKSELTEARYSLIPDVKAQGTTACNLPRPAKAIVSAPIGSQSSDINRSKRIIAFPLPLLLLLTVQIN